MAESALAPEETRHTRSISLPSGSHPVVHWTEEELHKLRSSMASSSSTPQTIRDRLRDLGGLYEHIKELICLTSNRKILIHPLQKKWVEEELDASIRLLDLCSAVRTSLTTMEEHIQRLQLALRRRDTAAIVNRVNAYVRLGRKADKDIKNCFRSLKQMDDKHIHKNNDLPPTVIVVLMEIKVITVALLRLVSSFLSLQTGRTKSSRWSFVSKALSKRKVTSEGEHEDASGVERLYIFSWLAPCDWISCKDVDGEKVLKAQSQLQMLEASIEGLDQGLECLFKQLIQIRVSLLNVLNS